MNYLFIGGPLDGERWGFDDPPAMFSIPTMDCKKEIGKHHYRLLSVITAIGKVTQVYVSQDLTDEQVIDRYNPKGTA